MRNKQQSGSEWVIRDALGDVHAGNETQQSTSSSVFKPSTQSVCVWQHVTIMFLGDDLGMRLNNQLFFFLSFSIISFLSKCFCSISSLTKNDAHYIFAEHVKMTTLLLSKCFSTAKRSQRASIHFCMILKSIRRLLKLELCNPSQRTWSLFILVSYTIALWSFIINKSANRLHSGGLRKIRWSY